MKHASNLDPALTGNPTWVHWLEAQLATTELGPTDRSAATVHKNGLLSKNHSQCDKPLQFPWNMRITYVLDEIPIIN